MSEKRAHLVTLITGSRKGIGRYLTEYFLKRGHQVIGCSRQPSDLVHPRYEHLLIDVSQESDISHLITHIQKTWGRLDNVINNAGIACMNHVLLTPLTSVHDIFQTNFVGTFLVCREATRLMIRQKSGRIVNFTSVAVPLEIEGEAVYAASKAAVETFSRILAKELAPHAITVNVIGPGPTETDLIKNIPKEKIDAILNKQKLKKLTEMGEISQVIEKWLHPESLITGQIVYLGQEPKEK